MADPLRTLKDHLLRAGIGLRIATRYVTELSEHRDDIAEQLQARGMDSATARREAESRLGTIEQLALPLLVDPRCRSLSSRLPVLVYLALPIAAQIFASALPVILLGLTAGHLPSDAALPDLASIIALAWLILPVAIAWLVLAAAGRRRARLIWPLLGAICGVLLATALRLDIAAPGNGQPGAISVAIATPSPLPLIVLLAVSILPLSLPAQFRNS